MIYFGLKLVQKYNENLCKSGIVVRLVSSFLSPVKYSYKKREK